MSRLVLGVLSTVLTALLAGCGGDAPPTTTVNPSPSVPAPAASTATSSGDQEGEWDLVLTEVRAGHHQGADRVVLEFEGTGTPGWVVGYVERPRLEGSGDPAPVGGDHVIQVVASGTTYPAEIDEALGLEHVPPTGAEAVTDVFLGGTFEGYTQLFVGVDGEPRPFTVTTLADPARLVVDVRP